MNKTTILIVDDEPYIVEMLALRLEANDFTVLKAYSGSEALNVLEKEEGVDVMMCDIMMPEMTGIELLREVKRTRPGIEVIMVTGFASLDTAVEAVRLGAYDYLKKPFEDMHAMLKVVNFAAEKRRLISENRRLTDELKSSNEMLTRTNLMMGENFNELAMLHHIVSAISSKAGLDEVIEEFLNGIVASMEFRRAALFIIDKSQRTLELKGAKGWDAKGNETVMYRMDGLPKEIETVFKTMEHVYQSGFKKAPKDRFLASFASADSRTLIYYPLEMRAEPFGLLMLESGREVHLTRVHSLALLINQVVLILENAKMFSKLMRMNEELKELDSLKTDFISTISHELRTPLASLKSGVELVMDEVVGDIGEKQKRALHISKHNIDRLTRLIDDLLDISRIESGKVVLARKKVSLAGTIKKAAISLRPYLKEKGLEVKELLPRRLPNVFIDEDRVIQVMVNLISNAANYSRAGGVIDIEADMSKKEGFVEVHVTDHGVGIAREDMPKLFHKFSQLHRVPGPGAKGTGLDLAICKELLLMHSCEIWVKRSVPNKGTTFAFTLPVHDKETEDVMVINDNIDSEVKRMNRLRGNFSLVGFNYKRKTAGREMASDKEAVAGLLPSADDKAGIYEDGRIVCVLKGMNKSAAAEWSGDISNKVFKKRKDDISCVIVGFPSDGANRDELIKKL
jgi:signal transduction histidine kinase/FixJ family two-component response regulator